MIQTLWRTVWRFLKILGIKLTYDPAIPFLSTYPEKTKIRKDTIFIAAVFAIARTWRQSRCPSTDKGIKVMWYKYTMEYYSAIKKNKFESVEVRWVNLEPVMQNEVNQKEKNMHHTLTHMYAI